MIRARAPWAAAGLLGAFLVVLAVPDRDRALALYAFLLLSGGLVLTALVALLAARAPGGEDRLTALPVEPDRRPAELDAIERDVREALERGVVEERLRVLARSVAIARLARHGGVESAPERLPAQGALAELLAPRRAGELRGRLRAGQLEEAVAELERL